MRWFCCVLLLIGLTVRAADDKADEAKDAKTIIADAIAAAGGKEKLALLDRCIVKGKGSLDLAGTRCPFTIETRYQLPDRVVSIIEVEVAGRKHAIKQGIVGDKAWTSLDGVVSDLADAELTEAREELRVGALTRLLPLLDEKYTLEAVPAAKDQVAVRVTAEGQRPFDLTFDYAGKKVGMLLKVVRKAPAPDTGKEAVQETTCADYKDGDQGVKYPSKTTITRDRKQVVEMEVIELKPGAKIEDKDFAKP